MHLCVEGREGDESLWGKNSSAHKQLSLPKRVLNFVHDEPARMLAYLGVPFAASLLYRNLSMPTLTLSQRLMHTRVQAQSGVLIILGITISLNAFMISKGRFPDPNDRIDGLIDDDKPN